MSNKTSDKKSSLPNFLSALTGALIGGLLVFLLTNGFGAMTNDNSSNEAANPPQTKAEEANVSKKEIDKSIGNLDADDSGASMESKVVKKSINSVVGITTKSQVTQETFWGPQSGYVEGIGSGSIVSSDGYILTNSHVVSNGDTSEISVLFNDGTTTPAKLVWNDSTLDLAIIKVEKKNLPAMELADSDDVGVGDRVVAIGNPLGFELQSTVTSGIISGLNRTVSFQTGAQMDGLMQTDAAINSGNSGGALLNSKGQQIGINSAKAGNSDGIGFAIPINTVKSVIEQIIKNGEYKSVYLGITGQSLDYFKQFPQANMGALEDVDGVYVFSDFDQNGVFQKGDVITAVDGKKVTDMASLRKVLLDYQIGQSAEITLIRDGKEQKVNFTFKIDSSNVDEYKQASPENKVEKNEEENSSINPFNNLP
ncbi:trypsin-like peptidase domain-containing protein [Anaerococcus sp. mt242]|uniref:S1C family serine protease n=1 Tax=Anaerococcus sp. mt242 TaxID=2661917 RepID=UPI00193244B6|nr:trypsin-like peptidase domain-containing protein [Anaerococcus sp. mt242]MBM0046626.1 trypsin-like peptidase domain-containing protein [Anaerococcus sp. mt242]